MFWNGRLIGKTDVAQYADDTHLSTWLFYSFPFIDFALPIHARDRHDDTRGMSVTAEISILDGGGILH